MAELLLVPVESVGAFEFAAATVLDVQPGRAGYRERREGEG